jgi:hypothetical protein
MAYPPKSAGYSPALTGPIAAAAPGTGLLAHELAITKPGPSSVASQPRPATN